MGVGRDSSFDMLLRSVGLAWRWTGHVLFRPFILPKWLILGFAAWLADLASGGGGGLFNLPGFPFRLPGAGQPSPTRELAELQARLAHMTQWLTGHLDAVIIAVVLGGLLLVVVGLLLLWVSSRGKFVFLECVVRNRAAIRAPWKEVTELGNSLFLWRLGFGIAVGTALALVGGMGLLLLVLKTGVAGTLIVVGCIGSVLVVVAVFVSVFLEAFVVPLMYRYSLRSSAAWSYFLKLFRLHSGAFVLYAISRGVLAIGAMAILFGVITMTCCCGLLPLLLPYVSAVCLLPFTVFFRSFSVYFLQQFHAEYRIIQDEFPAGPPQSPR